jgi:hypothetical protein
VKIADDSLMNDPVNSSVDELKYPEFEVHLQKQKGLMKKTGSDF